MQYLTLMITSSDLGMDTLRQMHLLIAANNTWQGIIHKSWPYNKEPPLISGEFDPETYKLIVIQLEENILKYYTGGSDFNRCINEFGDENCKSIFDPKFYKCNNWYIKLI